MIFVTYFAGLLSFSDFCILPQLSVLFVMNVALKHLTWLMPRKTVTDFCLKPQIITPFA
jgi:hypothetical protein